VYVYMVGLNRLYVSELSPLSSEVTFSSFSPGKTLELHKSFYFYSVGLKPLTPGSLSSFFVVEETN